MGPVQLRVRVHHLRLDSQPELHAEVPHVIGEPVQPAGPDRLVDLPVAEDVPFHADAGGLVGQGRQRGEVVPDKPVLISSK